MWLKAEDKIKTWRLEWRKAELSGLHSLKRSGAVEQQRRAKVGANSLVSKRYARRRQHRALARHLQKVLYGRKLASRGKL